MLIKIQDNSKPGTTTFDQVEVGSIFEYAPCPDEVYFKVNISGNVVAVNRAGRYVNFSSTSVVTPRPKSFLTIVRE